LCFFYSSCPFPSSILPSSYPPHVLPLLLHLFFCCSSFILLSLPHSPILLLFFPTFCSCSFFCGVLPRGVVRSGPGKGRWLRREAGACPLT
jgi:hypothetical protein